jgi:hypothetical protein
LLDHAVKESAADPELFLRFYQIGNLMEEFQLGDAAVRVPERGIEQVVSPACPGVRPPPAHRFALEYLLIHAPGAYLFAAVEILVAFLIAGRSEFPCDYRIDIFNIAIAVYYIGAIAHGVEDVLQIVQ